MNHPPPALDAYCRILSYRHTPGPALELGALGVAFHKTPVLDNLTLSLPAGRTTAIVGPNGSGKSTFIKAILGQYRHSGSIRIHWPEPAHPHIAYVPQHIDFDRELPMNAEDFLAMLLQRRPIFLGLARPQKSIIHHLLERAGMFERRHTRIGRLSGGELKRMLIIQALYPEPGLILLDEPLAALDEPGMAMFARFLGEWQAMGKTILWVEHDLLAVQKLAHHLLAINRRLIHSGSPHDLADPALLMQIFSHSQAHEPPGAHHV